MGALHSTAAIAAIGFLTLGAGHVQRPLAGLPTAVLVPPWRPAGLAFAAEVGLPVIDIRWGGHLLLFAPTEDPLILSRLGPFAMPADGIAGCAAVSDDNGATN